MADLVLLHPFPLDAGFWDPVRQELGSGWAVRAPDLPGFGGAARRPGWVMDDPADLVAGALDRPAVVCGLSMGGYVALSLALRHPDAVRALVLANTRADADGEEARRARGEAADRIRAGGLGDYLDELLPRLVAPEASAATVAAVRRIAARQRPEAVVDALGALRDRPDRTGALDAIGVPTLVVWGDRDAITPYDAMVALAGGIERSRIEVVAGAGHLSAIERPGPFAALVASLG